MKNKPIPEPATFAQAARVVSRRLLLVRWMRGMKRSAVPVALTGIAIVLGLRLLGARWADLALALPAMLVWAGAVFAWSWWRCPRGGEALGVWDHRAGRRETFLSAHWFEQQPEPSIGQRLHLGRAREGLMQAWSRLRHDLPLGFDHRVWIAPLVLLLFAASPLLQTPLAAEDRPLDPQAREQVARISELIAERREQLDELRGLDPDEKKQVDRIKEKLEQTARELKEGALNTRREALSEIESLASELDKLAASLADAGGESGVSSGMIEELERHTDTADFGSALRTAETDRKAEESRKLADRLDREGLTLDEKQRFKRAFDKAIEQATDHDHRTPEGKAVNIADRGMKADQQKRAADAFRELAKRFENQAKREAAAQRLEQLAQRFRSGGQRLVNANQGQMQRLASAGQSGSSNGAMRRLGGQPLAPRPRVGGSSMSGQQQAGAQGSARPGSAPSGGSMPVPGQQPSSMPGRQPAAAGGQQPPIPGSQPTPGGGLTPGPGPMPGAGQMPGGGQTQMAGGPPPIPGTGQMPGAGQMPGVGPMPGAGNMPGGWTAADPWHRPDARCRPDAGRGPDARCRPDAGRGPDAWSREHAGRRRRRRCRRRCGGRGDARQRQRRRRAGSGQRLGRPRRRRDEAAPSQRRRPGRCHAPQRRPVDGARD